MCMMSGAMEGKMITVEHDKRKRDILEAALKVFMEDGYEGTTFQKIADRLALTRTTLYIYFRSKREIFLLCIKQLTDNLYSELRTTLMDNTLGAEAALRKILSQIVDCVAENSPLFSVLLVYLLQLKDDGVNPNERILRRILRLRHILSTVLIRGMKSGEFRPLVVHDANDLFYGLIESAVFHLSLDSKASGYHHQIEDVRTALRFAIDGILADKKDNV